jgi:thiol-disulfide isomerase/thioredoxin
MQPTEITKVKNVRFQIVIIYLSWEVLCVIFLRWFYYLENHDLLAGYSMSKVNVEFELGDLLKDKNHVFVLFYASWCPFSQRFLPIFEKQEKANPQICMRVKIDDKARLREKYEVDVVPTVLLFESGAVTKRLDGEPGAGLSEKQLKNLMGSYSR